MTGTMDQLTDRTVRRTLLTLRWKHAIAPYFAIFKLGWEIINGQYWRAAKEVHGSSNTASGASAGAFAAPVAQFAGPGVTFPTAASAATFDDAGIRAGEVRAYRCWLLRNGLLRSVTQDFYWQPGETVAGDAEHGEGVHAFKSILLMSEYGIYRENDIVVTGTIDLWGEVYEHELGYRASYAAVASIDDSPDYDAAELRKLYGLNRKRKKKKGQEL